jgi:hypothetical protein
MRMPSYSRSYEDWADYLLEHGLSVDDAINKTSSEAVASWLDERRDYIEGVLKVKGTAVATFMTEAEFIEMEEESSDDPDYDDEVPAKGIRV